MSIHRIYSSGRWQVSRLSLNTIQSCRSISLEGRLSSMFTMDASTRVLQVALQCSEAHALLCQAPQKPLTVAMCQESSKVVSRQGPSTAPRLKQSASTSDLRSSVHVHLRIQIQAPFLLFLPVPPSRSTWPNLNQAEAF